MSEKDSKDSKEQKDSKDQTKRYLVANSPTFQAVKEEFLQAVKLSMTGIVNLVVKHEDPTIVDAFLREAFKFESLYNNTCDIDAVELQAGSPGRGFSTKFIDDLIYGKVAMKEDADGTPYIDTDPQTGKKKREANGFVNRKEVFSPDLKDKNLIIKNIDYALDFCKDKPGEIDSRSLYIFDNFRSSAVRKKCRLILVTNKKIVLPFKIRTVEFRMVTDYEANHLIQAIVDQYLKNDHTISFTSNQKSQIVRKISGLTFTNAGDTFLDAISVSESNKIVDSVKVLKNLREKINKSYMEDGCGLTALSPRPWEDYICPETSNFTYDVKKILRDFKEVERLRKIAEDKIKNGEDESEEEETIEAIKTRIPHVIVVYGKGGVGKSALPIHLAGLLDFDVWDFNVNATHSKWIGEGSRQMREALTKISMTSHIIIRIDEYDRGIGATNDSGQGMHEAHKQVEAEFMNWLQNCQEENLFVKQNIIVVLTTNHKENITGPLLRSGRSDLVIDIDNFDSKSMKETFVTTARRMKNRGTKVIGFATAEELQRAINILDLDYLSEIASIKGFTVRDIETYIMEMAAHAYYFKITNGKEGMAWIQENFAEVMEHSEGSVKDDTTGELVLGDRYVFQQRARKSSTDKEEALFKDDSDHIIDPEKIKL